MAPLEHLVQLADRISNPLRLSNTWFGQLLDRIIVIRLGLSFSGGLNIETLGFTM